LIRRFLHAGDGLVPAAAGGLWIDLLEPAAEELSRVASETGLALPGRAEMEEIELSSRLYWDNGAAFMTAVLPSGTDSDQPRVGPVTFVLAPDRLVTIRYHNPRSFDLYPTRAQKTAFGCASAEAVLLGIVEEMVDRLADVLERVGSEIDAVAHAVFRPAASPQGKSRDLAKLIEEIGRKEDLVSKLRDCLMSLQRIMGFLSQVLMQRGSAKGLREAAKTHGRDIHSLLEHATFLSQKTNFVLEALLGLISVEQNSIIKIFSVAAVMFLPPTLVASVYGMNFDVMPETEWTFGYPMALGLMVVSALVPFLFFRRRGWL
jgi:magnesium transporter